MSALSILIFVLMLVQRQAITASPHGIFQMSFRFENTIESTIEGTVLENVESIKYLGVTITNDLKWNTHISNVCTKTNRILGFLRRKLYSCPQDMTEAAYKGLVRPVLECESSVLDPQENLEKV